MTICPRCGVGLMPVLYEKHGLVVAAICPDMCLIVDPPRADNLAVYYDPPIEWGPVQLELEIRMAT